MGSRIDNRVIPVRKSRGISTYDVIRRFRKIFGPVKVGHSGTLDPEATGLVLLLTGRATRLSGYLMDLPKTYVADIKLGESTDTHDTEGTVVERGDWTGVSAGRIGEVLEGFIGRRTQVPPMYSAVKHRGRPLYELARRGEEVERKPREVEIYSIELISVDLPVFTMETECSRGMYVRVLAEEIGAELGIPAHLGGLERTRVGHFRVEDAVPDDELESLAGEDSPGVGPAEALSHLPAVELSEGEAERLANGIPPKIPAGTAPEGAVARLILPGGELGAIAGIGPAGSVRLRRVFVASPEDRGDG